MVAAANCRSVGVRIASSSFSDKRARTTFVAQVQQALMVIQGA
jgi:hypothetical protein